MDQNCYVRLDTRPVDEAAALIGEALAQLGLSGKSVRDVWTSLGGALSLLNAYQIEKGYVRNDRIGIFRFRGHETDSSGRPVRYAYSFEKIHKSMLLLLDSYMDLRDYTSDTYCTPDSYLMRAKELILEACFDRLGRYCVVTFSDIKNFRNSIGSELNFERSIYEYDIMYGKFPWHMDPEGDVIVDLDPSDRDGILVGANPKVPEEPPFRETPKVETSLSTLSDEIVTQVTDADNSSNAMVDLDAILYPDSNFGLVSLEDYVKTHRLSSRELIKIAAAGYFVKRNDKSYVVCPSGLYMKKIYQQKTAARFQYPQSCDNCTQTECIGKKRHSYYYFSNKQFIKPMADSKQTPAGDNNDKQ